MSNYVDACYRDLGYALGDVPCVVLEYVLGRGNCYWDRGYAVDDPLCGDTGNYDGDPGTGSDGAGSGGGTIYTPGLGDPDSLMVGLVFDRAVPDAPLTKTRISTSAVHARRDTGELYIVDKGTGYIKKWDGDDYNRLPYEWKSKVFITPKPVNFSFVQVILDNLYGDVDAKVLAAIEANQLLWSQGAWRAGLNDVMPCQYEVNGSAMQNLPTIDPVYAAVYVYANGALVWSQYVESEVLYRLPAGFKATRWEVKVTGNKGVRRITLATSAVEIAAT